MLLRRRFHRDTRRRLRLFHRGGLGGWLEGYGRLGLEAAVRRAGYGEAASVVARRRKRAASGQALAKATRTRLAVSMTRAATLRRRSQSVVNSAVFSALAAGIASYSCHISQ